MGDGVYVKTLGAYPEKVFKRLNLPFEVPPSLIHNFPYFSWASLSNVSSTQTFSDRHDGYCEGIILRYGDGAERAVGQCRLGKDCQTICERPSLLHYNKCSYITRDDKVRQTLQIVFMNKKKVGKESREGVAYRESRVMKGRIVFWFTEYESVISF
jgi:hypothetical protein